MGNSLPTPATQLIFHGEETKEIRNQKFNKEAITTGGKLAEN